MSENNIKYLLGIDGGGTKTEFLLTDMNEKEIKRIFLGASNPVNIGLENTKALLKEGITEICDGYDFSEIAVFAGLAKLVINGSDLHFLAANFDFLRVGRIHGAEWAGTRACAAFVTDLTLEKGSGLQFHIG